MSDASARMRDVRLSGVLGPWSEWPDQDLVALTAEFDAPLTLEAYCAGAFPMPLHDAGLPEGVMGWWSPMRRAILPLGDLRVTRSLRKSARHYRVSVDRAFDEVIARVATRGVRTAGSTRHRRVFTELHAAGAVHSVEV